MLEDEYDESVDLLYQNHLEMLHRNKYLQSSKIDSTSAMMNTQLTHQGSWQWHQKIRMATMSHNHLLDEDEVIEDNTDVLWGGIEKVGVFHV